MSYKNTIRYYDAPHLLNQKVKGRLKHSPTVIALVALGVIWFVWKLWDR